MNLEQVARRAKVSTATVSRVLNDASVVKNSTRARVMKAIEELKYHPNLHARNLAGGKSKTIGVIVSHVWPTLPTSCGPTAQRSSTNFSSSDADGHPRPTVSSWPRP